MPTNGFLPNSTGVGAVVLSDADYASSPAVAQGAQVGTLPPAYYNKVNRQATVIASMIGQFIVDKASVDANDSQSIALLEANFIAALNAAVSMNTQQTIATNKITGAKRYPFFTPGTTNWTVPANVYTIDVQCWGAGGGGFGGSGAAGAAGGYAAGVYSVQPGQIIPIIIGAGGAGNNGSGAAAAGGASSVGNPAGGSFCSATGGAAGANGSTPGGTGSGGDLNLSGASGQDLDGVTTFALGGATSFGGGSSPYTGLLPGGGGGASATNSGIGAAGFNGAPGGVIIRA